MLLRVPFDEKRGGPVFFADFALFRQFQMLTICYRNVFLVEYDTIHIFLYILTFAEVATLLRNV